MSGNSDTNKIPNFANKFILNKISKDFSFQEGQKLDDMQTSFERSMFNRMDKNKDKKLSAEEIENYYNALLAKYAQTDETEELPITDNGVPANEENFVIELKIFDDEEETQADKIFKLFSDSGKVSASIDAQATSLGKDYIGEIMLPKNATFEKGQFPQELRMTLPEGYDGTMRLLLIKDYAEDGIYQTTAHDRHYQIIVDDNGNVHAKAVHLDELEKTLEEHLEKYEEIKQEKARLAQAQQEQAQQEQANDNVQVNPVFSQNTSSAEQKQKADGIAYRFRGIAEKNRGYDSTQQMQKMVDNEFTPENIVAILDSYNTWGKGDSSIIATILGETKAVIQPNALKARKKLITDIMENLIAAANNEGVPKDKIDECIDKFNKYINATNYSKNAENLEKVINELKADILVEQNTRNISSDDAMTGAVNIAKKENSYATNLFDTARSEKKGWSSIVGDYFLWRYGQQTNAGMKQRLEEHYTLIDELSKAKDSEEFKYIFKNGTFIDGVKIPGFHIDFDENKMATYTELVGKYELAANLQKTSQICEACKWVPDYQIIGEVSRNFGFDQKTLDSIIAQYSTNSYAANHSLQEKADCLRRFLDDVMQNSRAELQALTDGKSVSDLANDVQIITRSTFGDSDVVKEVIEHNQNERMAAMYTEYAAEMAGTIALQFVPGLNAAASVRLAKTTAKWGPRAAKIRNMAVKAEKIATTTEKVLTGMEMTTGGRMVTEMAKIGVASTGVNASNGMSLEDSFKTALHKMPFASVGVGASKLTPIISKTFGISNEFALSIAEELISDIGSGGVVILQGGQYTTEDGLVDFISGFVLARIARSVGGTPQAKTVHGTGSKPATKPHTSTTTAKTVQMYPNGTPAKPNGIVTPETGTTTAKTVELNPNTEYIYGTTISKDMIPPELMPDKEILSYYHYTDPRTGKEFEIPIVYEKDGSTAFDNKKILTLDDEGKYRRAVKEDFPNGQLAINQHVINTLTGTPLIAAGTDNPGPIKILGQHTKQPTSSNKKGTSINSQITNIDNKIKDIDVEIKKTELDIIQLNNKRNIFNRNKVDEEIEFLQSKLKTYKDEKNDFLKQKKELQNPKINENQTTGTPTNNEPGKEYNPLTPEQEKILEKIDGRSLTPEQNKIRKQIEDAKNEIVSKHEYAYGIKNVKNEKEGKRDIIDRINSNITHITNLVNQGGDAPASAITGWNEKLEDLKKDLKLQQDFFDHANKIIKENEAKIDEWIHQLEASLDGTPIAQQNLSGAIGNTTSEVPTLGSSQLDDGSTLGGTPFDNKENSNPTKKAPIKLGTPSTENNPETKKHRYVIGNNPSDSPSPKAQPSALKPENLELDLRQYNELAKSNDIQAINTGIELLNESIRRYEYTIKQLENIPPNAELNQMIDIYNKNLNSLKLRRAELVHHRHQLQNPKTEGQTSQQKHRYNI